MKKQNLFELTLEQLTQKEKTLKQGLGIYIGILSVMVIALLLLFILKSFTIIPSLVAVFAALLAILSVHQKNMKDIKAEIETRQNS